MRIGFRLQHLKVLAGHPQFLIASFLGTYAGTAAARNPSAVPEPSMLSLLGVGVVAGIIAYRIKNKK